MLEKFKRSIKGEKGETVTIQANGVSVFTRVHTSGRGHTYKRRRFERRG